MELGVQSRLDTPASDSDTLRQSGKTVDVLAMRVAVPVVPTTLATQLHSFPSEHSSTAASVKRQDSDSDTVKPIDPRSQNKHVPVSLAENLGCDPDSTSGSSGVKQQPSVVTTGIAGSPGQVVGDVESHYNYHQYTSHFVHSLQT
ncbi:hypothetical protein BaRGS_00025230 [Batillaria attramentaria]|uniref:Uncharacterized protein n=1 Tax=Batillaria attramentaria TaxID=370345 RepID=A0ABD0K8Y9_9CAEN